MTIYTLPDLPYDAGALAPHISAELMTLHHDKHHAAYVKGANETLERLGTAEEWAAPGLERALAFHERPPAALAVLDVHDAGEA